VGCLRTGNEIAAWPMLGDDRAADDGRSVLPRVHGIARRHERRGRSRLKRLRGALHPLDDSAGGRALESGFELEGHCCRPESPGRRRCWWA
jgi:predicted Fe-S protein YdhL (DUF1289 family)